MATVASQGILPTVCRSKPVAQSAGSRSHIATVIAAMQTTRAPTVDVLVTSATGQTVQVQAIPDTGTDVSAAGPGFIDLLSGSLEELAPTTERPESADGSLMHVLGSVSVTLTIGEHSVQTPVLIVDRLKGLLLSWECNGTELHPQSVHHTVHPQIMSWQESSDLSLKVSPHVRRGARLRKKKEEERNGDGRHGYKMATVAMVIISDGRHGYKMATDA